MRLLRVFRQRLRSLFRRAAVEAELERELAWHLEQLMEENIADGMDPREAQLAARRALGGAALVADQCRDQRRLNWLTDVTRDVRYAWRMLAKHPGFTAVAALTLALGVGGSIAVFVLGDALLVRSLPFPHAERLVLISSVHARRGESGVGQQDFRDWQAANSVFERMTYTEFDEATLTGLGDAERITGRAVSAGFFELLRVQPMLGRWFTPAEQEPGGDRVVMLSHQFWVRAFGGRADAVGSTLNLNERAYHIVGVMPKDFRFNEGHTTDFWKPIEYRNYGRMQHQYAAYGRLKPGVSVEAAQAQMSQIARRLAEMFPATNGDWSVRVRGMRAALLEEGVGPALLVFSVAVTIVLLIACGNVASLLLARGIGRTKEIAIRLALGGSRMRVMRLLLTESVMLAVFGTMAGLAFAAALVKAAIAVAPPWMKLESAIEVSAPAVLFTVGLALITGLLTGAVPAFRGSRNEVGQTLKESGTSLVAGRKHERALRTLVAAEVALAVVLLCFAGLFVKSFAGLVRTGVGFPTDRLLTFRLTFPRTRYPDRAARLRFADKLLSQVASIPGVSSAAGAGAIPLGGVSASTDVEIEGVPDARDWADRSAGIGMVTPNYFRTLGVALRSGRAFSAADSENAEAVAIVNESFVRKFLPDMSPLGHRFRLGRGNWTRIVGVVADFRHGGPSKPIRAETFVPFAQDPYLQFVVLRSAIPEQQLTRAVRERIRELDSAMPMGRMRTMNEALAESTAMPRYMAAFLSGFALVAVAMAVLGLAGVLAYAVSQRTREIGLRMALGARPGDISRGVIRSAGLLVAAGLVIGIAVALAAGRLLASVLYGVRPNDATVFAVAPVALAAVALLTCLLPARRAASVEPAAALRQE